MTDPVHTWEGDGRPALILGTLREISTRRGSSRKQAILNPLFCLGGRFDPSVCAKMPVAFTAGANGSLPALPPPGAMVLAVVRIYDEDPSALHGVVVSERCPFMPDGAGMIVLKGLDDPRIESVIINLLGR